ncbi:MAG TPA: helix-turn-helix domain-containing protein [Gemmatimonadaceae bacterium]
MSDPDSPTTTASAASPLLSKDEAAKRLGVSRRSIERHVQRGRLVPAAYEGQAHRYAPEDVDRLREPGIALDRHRQARVAGLSEEAARALIAAAVDAVEAAHREALAAKDETIAALQAEVARLAAAADRHRQAEVATPARPWWARLRRGRA